MNPGINQRASTVIMSVVVPTHNKAELLPQTLAALVDQTLPAEMFEIIVVDNGSSDGTRAVVEGLTAAHPAGHPILRYLWEPVLGRSRARNTGIAAARGEFVLLLDDDIRVARDHLEQLVAHHRQQPGSVVMGLIEDASPIRPAFLHRYFNERQTMGSSSVGLGSVELDYTNSRSGDMSIERQALEAIADVAPDGRRIYMDEELARREDTYMGYKLQQQGQKFLFARDAVCTHYHPRGWENIRANTVGGGYYLYWLHQRVPELRARERAVIESRPKNLALLGGSLLALPVGLLIEPLSPWLARKATSGMLAGLSNTGYQRAMREDAAARAQAALQGTAAEQGAPAKEAGD